MSSLHDDIARALDKDREIVAAAEDAERDKKYAREEAGRISREERFITAFERLTHAVERIEQTINQARCSGELRCKR